MSFRTNEKDLPEVLCDTSPMEVEPYGYIQSGTFSVWNPLGGLLRLHQYLMRRGLLKAMFKLYHFGRSFEKLWPYHGQILVFRSSFDGSYDDKSLANFH